MIDHPSVLIHGLKSSYTRWPKQEYAKPSAEAAGDAYIDIELAWLVRRLNYIGVETLYCCQGGPDDEWDDGYINPGYISYLGWLRDNEVKYEIESALAVEVFVIEHDKFPLTNEPRTLMKWMPK